MKYKIGVFGSAENINDTAKDMSKAVGRILAQKNCIVITGGCSGLPYLAAYEASKNGSEVWGFSPEYNLDEQKKAFIKDDYKIYTKLIYITEKTTILTDRFVRLKYRNVTSTGNCDAGIIVSGRWGSMNEFTNLFDMGKIIGVLEGTGGIADELRHLTQKISKKSQAKSIFNADPTLLVEEMLHELSSKTRSIDHN